MFLEKQTPGFYLVSILYGVTQSTDKNAKDGKFPRSWQSAGRKNVPAYSGSNLHLALFVRNFFPFLIHHYLTFIKLRQC